MMHTVKHLISGNTRLTRTTLTLVAGLVALTATLSTGCGTTYIGNTEIADNEENREIYEQVMLYQRAVMARDSDQILSMVSRTYYENSTTTDTSMDDYGYDRLRVHLSSELQDNVLDVNFRVLMRRINTDGQRATADYEYYYTFKYTEGGTTAWKERNDFNRLEFVREDGMWKITGGL
ncbi:MAG: methionine-rich copper-binding protein CopC [Myxococcota bacterium]|jgi:methionine-rich copper-binding protein CopC